MNKFSFFISISGLFGLVSCSGNASESAVLPIDTVQTDSAPVLEDDHSYSNVHDVYSKHLHLDLAVDFERKVLSGSVVHTIENVNGVTEMVFDMNDEAIQKITLDDDTAATAYTIGEDDELLGSALTVQIKPETKKVTIYYESDPGSNSLQWLTPQQTAGKKHPYLYTQGQAVLTRTWIPCQDTPLKRITYRPTLKRLQT